MTEQETAGVAEIVERYSGDRGMLIPMMQDIQAECGYLPRDELKELSRRLRVPLAQLYSVATFYASFRLVPRGDHTVSLCMGTVCFLKGAEKISDAIRKEFDLVPGGTSPDGKFTFSPVNCVGACALAPVMVVDGEYHGGLTVDSAAEILRKIAAGGKPEAGGEARAERREGEEEPLNVDSHPAGEGGPPGAPSDGRPHVGAGGGAPPPPGGGASWRAVFCASPVRLGGSLALPAGSSAPARGRWRAEEEGRRCRQEGRREGSHEKDQEEGHKEGHEEDQEEGPQG